MNIHDCITRNTLAPTDELESLWDSIIVPDDVKSRLVHHTVLAFRLRQELPFDATALHGLILLYGPPGTGKTTLARGLANHLAPVLGCTRLIEVNPHGLMSAEHGQSQQRVAELLSEIVPALADDGKPTLVLIDEVESMAVARSEASLGANPVDVHRATDAVLTALDANTVKYPHIVWLTTSNFTEALDGAFRSRADATIEVPMPGAAGVQRILQDTLQRYGVAFPQLKSLADAPKLRQVAEQLGHLDGRQTRKFIVDALAQRLETAIDPNALTIADLTTAAKLIKEHN